MADKALPSPEVLRQLLCYEPETGKLFWRERTMEMFTPTARRGAGHICAAWNASNAGYEALSCGDGKGYLRGTFLGKTLYAHRAIWAMHCRKWPDQMLDHIDGDRCNNRIENLRPADIFINNQNMKISQRNSSGVVGVVWHAGAKKWIAQIGANGSRHHLGLHVRFEDAVVARREAEAKYNFGPAKRTRFQLT
jgi:HNH endonuclease